MLLAAVEAAGTPVVEDRVAPHEPYAGRASAWPAAGTGPGRPPAGAQHQEQGGPPPVRQRPADDATAHAALECRTTTVAATASATSFSADAMAVTGARSAAARRSGLGQTALALSDPR